jgi:sugar lactone lactonase YvrE
MDLEMLAEVSCSMGECPRWNQSEGVLYWCDMLGGTMHRYDPSSDEATRVYHGPNVGGFVHERDGSRLLFMEDGSVKRHDDVGNVATVSEGPRVDGAPVRFHDALVDPTGRVLCGAIPTDETPSLVYRLDTDGSFTPLIDDIGIANGLGLSPDGDRLYLADTDRDTVRAFAYDVDGGLVGDPEPFADVANEPGSPDGLVVDEAGHVWLAVTGGGRLVRFDADGTVVETVEFPVPTVTSLDFGGPDRDRAFVTTGTDQDAAEPASLAGALFGFDVDTAGVTRNGARIAF